jgi:trehalose 6-phosphate phosphatase
VTVTGVPLQDQVVQRLATVDDLLVASDFDGVIAPIVADPEAARGLESTVAALRLLADLPNTTVAIVSGRERRWLQQQFADPDRFVLIGSHGAEMGDDGVLDPALRTELDELTTALQELASSCPGLWVEPKALATAIHLRRAEESCRSSAAERVEELAAGWSAKVVRGKEVVEFTTATATKGDAIATLQQRLQPGGTVFFGDDVTDEDAFAVLGPNDLSVKVGPGSTAANYRVDDPEQVSVVLTRLADLRRSTAVR